MCHWQLYRFVCSVCCVSCSPFISHAAYKKSFDSTIIYISPLLYIAHAIMHFMYLTYLVCLTLHILCISYLTCLMYPRVSCILLYLTYLLVDLTCHTAHLNPESWWVLCPFHLFFKPLSLRSTAIFDQAEAYASLFPIQWADVQSQVCQLRISFPSCRPLSLKVLAAIC